MANPNRFVYPVRSLLSGIRPASEEERTSHVRSPAVSNVPGVAHVPARAIVRGEESAQIPSTGAEHARQQTDPIAAQSSLVAPDVQPGADRHSTHSDLLSSLLPTTTTYPPRRRKRSFNFRDFPEDYPFTPRAFSSMPPPQSSPTDDPALFDTEDVGSMFAPSLAGELFDPSADTGSDDYDPPQLPGIPVQALAEPAPVHFSQTGIVHLGPVESDSVSPSLRSGSASSSSRGRVNRRSDEAQPAFHVTPPLPVNDLGTVPTPASMSPSTSSESASGASSDGPRITFRYQHLQDEDGHHMILGREGRLTKCEDEPIRTPGAVQGFGVLIALEEDYESGNLTVRQVSENAAELLGLSPRYLFSLECFSHTLPEQQGDILFDNIQYLSDSSTTVEEQAENLHVFTLSGWGEPGTALADDLHNDPERRRHWACWCAAHRPRMTAPGNSTDPNADGTYTSSSSGSEQNVIILEFELERDIFNPLYPPMASEDASYLSGVSSPSDASASIGSASDSSGRTLVSSEDGQARTPDDSTPSNESSSPEGSSLPASGSNPSIMVSGTATSPSPSSGSYQSSYPVTSTSSDDWMPSPEDILESTTSCSKPILALERLRRSRHLVPESPPSPLSFGSGYETSGSRSCRTHPPRRRRRAAAVGMMDVFAVMAQINEQLGAAPDLESFLKVTAGVIKDLTQFHRVLVYQFDEAWNGQVVAELVDWNQSHELFRGLHFPSTDIPAQARELYVLNKVRLLYDRGQPTARLVVRSKKDLETPLDMTHCYLRAMSPIHIKYLGNMGVRASMSISIVAFGQLWGLVACHSYGPHGMRVSFPVRQMLRLLSQSISRNIERLSYAQRLHTRKLINTMPTEQHPSGYIVSNANDLLGLFDADYGVLVIGEGAKILGPNEHGQEILIVAEYLRLKQFNTLQVSQVVTEDYPDLQLTNGLEVIAGLLYVPLSIGGRDFIVFLRKGQPRQVKWAGRPYRDNEPRNALEPRSSFKTWSEVVAGRCRAWSDEHLETAGVLALVYGKFIEVWRQKESALQTTKLTNILLSNASHEVRTPLNHIINYLELALNGPLDLETRENLSQSHAASKSLLFTINDLLDLTRLESGNETSFNEPFNLHRAIVEATLLYRTEAARRGLAFNLDVSQCPKMVVGDAKKIRTVVANLTANALKYTESGEITVRCLAFEEPQGLRSEGNIAVEIIVEDTGCGIPSDKLESIFREFEQVESTAAKTPSKGLGLGLAVVARIVEQLGGQLRVDSRLNEGSRFSFLLPFATGQGSTRTSSLSPTLSSRSSMRSRSNSTGSHGSQLDSRGCHIDNLVEALSSSHMAERPGKHLDSSQPTSENSSMFRGIGERGKVAIVDSHTPIRPVKVDEFSLDPAVMKIPDRPFQRSPRKPPVVNTDPTMTQLRVLIVEDNDINRMVLAKRLALDGHLVVNTTNGQEGLAMVQSDREFDCILMDIQMPLLNGYEATERIRALEKGSKITSRLSQELNGRIPIFAVSASLIEQQRDEMYKLGIDGWILKPIDFKRLRIILRGITDPSQRAKDAYRPGCNWESGGWFVDQNKTSTRLK